MTQTGLSRLRTEGFARLRGRRVGLVCHPASVDRDFVHVLDLMLAHSVDVRAVFGPQHGLMGQTQDNMIEWEGGGHGAIPTYSLYGAVRRPTPEMLAGLDVLVIDLQDVGARYYTFVWTACECLEACAAAGVEVLILDRPNPIGRAVEGPVLEPEYRSFVGGHSIPVRHGMTVGEIARRYRADRGVDVELTVIEAVGEGRDLPWIPPSPNMPTRETALVYAGGCLLEGTNLSEGRGTCRPFEMFGAPFLNARTFADGLNGFGLAGAHFRPVEFEPTFNKHAGRTCGGAFLHVTDSERFRPVLTFLAVLQVAMAQSGLHATDAPDSDRFRTDSPEVGLPGFAWKRPPYEYVYDRLPFDILIGNGWVRAILEGGADLGEIRERMDATLGPS